MLEIRHDIFATTYSVQLFRLSHHFQVGNKPLRRYFAENALLEHAAPNTPAYNIHFLALVPMGENDARL